ncbi:unnamed protein product [Ceutorhynchus assimilis]|uniref:2-(3-amino-3-carboxypropyl)histidine synthase subunit 2 n=1 Tax=Ceutorhynchus assimilis TaxID=467358 RepID=A0A9N9MSN5_9CUCU|nr:unnamed protein product [Ceutorhynchus assimilis]
MPQFSTHENVSLEKEVEVKRAIIQTNSDVIEEVYDIAKCVGWIRENGFQKVCLQFPDHLLPDSSEIALRLQNILGETVYILGDTAYESCCIDYVAAAHINADAIIHFGPTCFSKTSANVPYLNVNEKLPLNALVFGAALKDHFECIGTDFVVVLDDGYIHHYDDVCSVLQGLEVKKINEETLDLIDKNVIFIGNNQRKLMNIDLNFKPKTLHYFDPNQNPLAFKKFQVDSKIIKRRYFLMEKIRDANTLGIVIGTLGVENYLKVIDRVKKLAELCGKKYYLISVGKPTVAKLANIGEIDIYVMITCSMNEIYDSRDFYKPIVTPFDVEMALNPNTSDIKFTYDFNRYLNNLNDITSIARNENETDVSLLTGKLRSNRPDSISEEPDNKDLQMALKSDGSLALNTNFGAGYLSERSWKGLEQNLGQTEVKMAEEGRKGIAQGYTNEQI